MKLDTLLRLIVIAFLLAFVICFMSSCSPERKLQRLVKKHPELLEKDSVSVVIPPDTVRINSIVNTTLTELDTLLNDTCISEETKTKIKYIIKEKLVPQIIQGVFKDTTITKDGVVVLVRNTDKGLSVDVVYSKINLTLQPKWVDRNDKWYILIIMILLFLLIYSRRK
jgi:hypothetical protein